MRARGVRGDRRPPPWRRHPFLTDVVTFWVARTCVAARFMAVSIAITSAWMEHFDSIEA